MKVLRTKQQVNDTSIGEIKEQMGLKLDQSEGVKIW